MLSEFMDDPPDELNALKEIVDPNVLVWTMRIRSSVADAERGNRCGR